MNPFGNISDPELVQGVSKSEKGAYRELFNRYAPRIYSFSVSYLKNRVDAEELVQEVFLKIWEKRNELDKSKNFKAFIFKIAVNSIYDVIRRKNLETAFADFVRLNFEKTSDHTWQTVTYNELAENLSGLVDRLPEQQRNIFLLNKEEGLTTGEIAEKLNLSKRTVENHLYRALSYLKAHFINGSLGSVLFFYLNC